MTYMDPSSSEASGREASVRMKTWLWMRSRHSAQNWDRLGVGIPRWIVSSTCTDHSDIIPVSARPTTLYLVLLPFYCDFLTIFHYRCFGPEKNLRGAFSRVHLCAPPAMPGAFCLFAQLLHSPDSGLSPRMPRGTSALLSWRRC